MKKVFFLFSTLVLVFSAPLQVLSFFPNESRPLPQYDDQKNAVNILVDQRFGTPLLVTPKEGNSLPLTTTAKTLSEKAFAFLTDYASLFDIENPSREYQIYKTFESQDGTNMKHIKLQQMKNNVEVLGAELIIHFSQEEKIVSVNGTRVSDVFDSPLPTISEDDARRVVHEQKETDALPLTDYTFSEDVRLVYLPGGFLADNNGETHLVWEVKTEHSISFVDAHSAKIIHEAARLKASRDRRVYTSNETTRLPGKQLMNESGYLYSPQQIPEPARTDSKEAYDYSGQTYDYYLRTFSRDSYDGRGSALLSSVNYYYRNLCPNAFWDSDRKQMIYCDQMTEANDVVAHELTHGVSHASVGNEEGFLGWGQYGALDESYSDVFGAMLDRTDWLIGEDILDIQPYFRNMANPTQSYPWQPDHAKYALEIKPPCNDGNDDCWIHINSGIPNKAAYLLGESGTRTHYGITVKGIGRTKTEQIYYKTLNEKLSPGSDFFASYRYSVVSCNELIGQFGITASDCTQVDNAFRAVGMNPLVQELVGPNTFDYFGNIEAMGDFNHDGYDDIVAGLPNNSDGAPYAGKVFVYYGSSRMDALPDKQIVSFVENEGFGSNVDSIGDVNGDGIDDFAVANGKPWNGERGRVYIYFGGQPLDLQADVLLDAPSGDELYGIFSSFRAGDVNGDGYDDVLISGYVGYNTSEPAKAYLYFGGTSMNTQIDGTFTSGVSYDFFAESLDGAGDLNRDGYDDLIIGARADNSRYFSGGKVYVYLGGPVVNTQPDLQIYGDGDGHGLGRQVTGAGDMNGDGYADMAVSDYFEHVHLYFGSAVLNDDPDGLFQAPSEDVFQDFGRSVNDVGDVNHDGYSDIIVGNPDNNGLESYFPKAYVYYGGNGIDDIADQIFIGERKDEEFGYIAGGGGDVNRDGFTDIFIGGNFSVNEGKGGIYIYSIF
ncbi:MAG: FG-GAP repeat protein [Candidatus Kerfeldbacteria bacterium]|nr:FG-GAP repeat protein [Candidatus Kerfeldbacteria bacterium]